MAGKFVFPSYFSTVKIFGVSAHILAVAEDSLGFSHILITEEDSLDLLPYSGNSRRWFGFTAIFCQQEHFPPHILTMIPLLRSHCNSPYAFLMEEVIGR
jgi:hypothetical protein